MTTTEHLNYGPDFYRTKESCLDGARDHRQTNQRYKNFTQKIFHAGDEEQFQQYRDATNGDVCIPEIPLNKNLFVDQPFRQWEKNKDLQADAVINTFRYIFHKFKKGIFVKIRDNRLSVFLPFSKANFVNEWSGQIHVDKAKYGNMNDFLRRIAEQEGRKFNPRGVNENIDEWYGNNCLVRYEYPLSEGESNVGNVKNMFEELCSRRRVPDIELFINRRDFPILTRDGTEPYNHIWGTSELPLVSHAYEKYTPILSMATSDRYADVSIPTWEDWARVQSHESIWFPRTCREYTETFNIPWDDKKPTAVFRGGTTGCGVTVDSNPRLKAAYLSSIAKPGADSIPYLDAGISNWNLRPRKLQNEKYLRTIDVKSLPFGLANRMTTQEQAGHKYIINIDGHVRAFRLSMELNMGSVILLVDSPWKLWYSDMLVPYEHFVPVKQDLSNLIAQIQWCRDNDATCEQIARNAKKFFEIYLRKDGILDYMQKTLVDLKDEMGVYLYNWETPLIALLQIEYHGLNFSYPVIDKNPNDVTMIPNMGRCFGLLQGIEWAIRKVIVEGDFESIAEEQEEMFQNKLGTIRHFRFAGFSTAVKTTFDKQKIREHVHEAYIGTHSINEMTKLVPNFAYIFGIYRKNDTFNVVTERIHGHTLHEYITSAEFDFRQYLFIIMQLCLAIQMAQNICGLVHYDLTPWNIVLQKLNKPMTFEYMLRHDQIVKVQTSLIPVIIDYGKSHVIHDGIHHGFINMFKVSTIQDILTLLITSIDQISSAQRLPQRDFGYLLRLANFLTGTKYRRETFENAKTLRNFLRKARKYSVLINSDKHELENLQPYDLVKFIMKNMHKDYKFNLGIIHEYNSSMDKGNGRQVFEYIFSNTTEERLQTYENVFIRLKHCTLPQPKNLFFVYYATQNLENNLVSVRNNMLYFLEREGISNVKYEKIFEHTMRFLHRVYQEKIDTMEEEDINYNIDSDFGTLIPAPYTEDTFLLPEVVLLLRNAPDKEDLSEYKEIIEMILVNRGMYKLREKDRVHYLKNFSKLLKTSSLNMKNNSANGKTLKTLSDDIYQKDLLDLNEKITLHDDQNCSDALQYMRLYKEF